MADVAKEIVTRLRLDSKNFNKGVDKTQKDIVKMSAAVTGLNAAISVATKAAANYQDEIIKTARATGATTEEFSVLNRSAELSGVSMDTLRGAMIKLTRPTDQAKETLRDLGVSLTDANGNMKSQSQLLGEIGDGFNKLQTPQQKTAAAFNLFEEAGTRMVSMLKGGSAGMREMAEEARMLGLIVSEEAGLQAEQFNDSVQGVQDAVKGLNVSIGESIIKFTNQSGIMVKLRDAIASVTQWWRGLDQNTKEIIIKFTSLIGVVAGAALALSGLIALAPTLGAAFAAMTGPIGLVITAIGLLAMEIVQNWEQVKGSVLPAVDAIKSAFNEIVGGIGSLVSEVVDTVGGVIDLFGDLAGSTGKTSEEFQILGTIANIVMKAIATNIIIVITPFKALFQAIVAVVRAIKEAGRAIALAVTGEFKKAGKAGKKALKELEDGFDNVKNTVVDAGGKIKQIWTSDTLVRAYRTEVAKGVVTTQELTKETKKLSEAQKNAVEPDRMVEFAKSVKGVADTAGILTGAFAQLADVTGQRILEAQKVVQRDFEVKIAQLKKANDAEMEAVKSVEEEKVEAIKRGFDDQINQIRMAEEQKTAIIRNAASQRQLALDEEFQRERQREIEKFESFKQSEIERYEFEKELLLQKAIDKEQRQLIEAELQQDFNAYMEQIEAEHETNLANLATNYRSKQRSEEAAQKAQMQQLEQSNNEKVKALTEQRNEALTKAEEEKDQRLIELEKEQQKKEKALEKEKIEAQWRAELAAFQSTKTAKIAEALVAGISGAAQAFAALAPIPFVGPALGAAAAAVIMAATKQRISLISEQKPVKPAALMMERGGVVAGRQSHAVGGVNAELESGEAVIDKERTSKIMDFVDGSMGSGIVINIGEGAIQTGDSLVDDRTIEQFSRRLGEEIERRGGR